jgi:transcription antitermination factor NusA-like protein
MLFQNEILIRVGHIVPIMIAKALPDYDSYLAMVAGTEILAILPKKYAQQGYKVGESAFAAVFSIDNRRIVLSQRSHHYFKRILEGVLAPVFQKGIVKIKRIAVVENCRFAKVALESTNGVDPADPVAECLPYLKECKEFTDYTIMLISYSPDIREYIKHALAPAPAHLIRRVIYFETPHEADVYVDGSPGLFFGKGGVNVAAAAKLTKVRINIKT